MSLPPAILSSLQILDAVARAGNFGAAGQLLNISQSAVSHRIKQLELSLNVSLVRRTTRKIELTDEGLRLATAARYALSEVSDALDDLKRQESDGGLSLSILSSFAAKWLVPHLPEFYGQYPDNRISVLAQDELVDLRRDQIDSALRYTRSPQPGLHATHLCKDLLVPIASPRLFKDGKLPQTPEELSQYPLLVGLAGAAFDLGYSWSHWFRGLGLDIDPEPVGPQYNRADLMIQTAIAGHGIILGRGMLLEQDLFESNLLVQVGPKVPALASYYFVTLAEKADWPKIVTFREWLKKSMSETYTKISDILY